MERRDFLGVLPLTIASLKVAKWGSAMSDERQLRCVAAVRGTIQKVMLAMLTMQRATWEQGVAMQALLELGAEEHVILMAKDAVLRQSEDGRLAMLGEDFALTDACAAGEAVLWSGKKTRDPSFQRAIDKLLAYIETKAPRCDDGTIYHFTNIPQIWSDATYMLPPFLAVVGKYEEAVRQILGIKKVLWNSDKKLLSHMWDCEKKQFARKDCWGVGNGWTAAGVTRVIRLLPPSMVHERTQLVAYVRDILDGCLAHMRSDGLYHNIVDNPQSFVETNLSQMLAYSIYRGIHGGWIEQSYKTFADTMRAAAHAKVDVYGLVQGVCGSPEFDHPGTATEGQAFFLMMEAAYYDLEGGR
ncbi:MAG: glycoside hydrolase family 88 protein [Bacteroidetes bacterium]|nr:glycoside hydrolase family 88 protein [Bacteroidota bacterium]